MRSWPERQFWNKKTHIGFTLESLSDFRQVMERVVNAMITPVIDSLNLLEKVR